MSKVKIKNNKEKIANLLLSIGCVNIDFKKQFTLTSGKKSPVYVDCRKLISFPKERELIINEMSKQIKSKYKDNSTIILATSKDIGKPGPLIDKLIYEKSNSLHCPLVIINGNLEDKEIEKII